MHCIITKNVNIWNQILLGDLFFLDLKLFKKPENLQPQYPQLKVPPRGFKNQITYVERMPNIRPTKQPVHLPLFTFGVGPFIYFLYCSISYGIFSSVFSLVHLHLVISLVIFSPPLLLLSDQCSGPYFVFLSLFILIK